MAGFIDSLLGIFGKKEKQQKPRDVPATTKTKPANSIPDDKCSSVRRVERIAVSHNNSETDQPDDDYRSITIHGRSIYDTPAPYHDLGHLGITWVGKDHPIDVQGYTIHSPLTYWSNNTFPEASCIITSLKVERPDATDIPPLPYWPKYSGLTPKQRGKYLTWMSHGRNDDLDEIGYAFIFFYGLERRALLENEDFDVILDEVNRLLLRYPDSNSFNSYLDQFIAYVIGLRLNEMKASDIHRFFPLFETLKGDTVKILLAWHWMNNMPVPWDLCYSLSKSHAGFPRTNITRKAPELLKPLFRKRFSRIFPQGIPFISDYEQFSLTYRNGSPTLFPSADYSRGRNVLKPIVVPIPKLTSPPYEELRKIWTECITELRPVVNQLDKTGGRLTRDAYNLLPDLLKEEIPPPHREEWLKLISSKQTPKGVLLTVGEIASFAGIEKREALTKSQSNQVVSVIHDYGYITLPDHIIAGTSLKWDDVVTVLPKPENSSRISEEFSAAALVFEMVYSIAASDEVVSDPEVTLLHSFVSEQFSLNTFERDCLKGLQQVLEIQPPSLSKIGKRVNKFLNPEQKSTLARFLGELVLVDNTFARGEEKALKSVFRALEIGPEESEILLKELLTGRIADEPITVLDRVKGRKGEAIPPKVVVPEFSIDQAKLKQTMEDTRAVQDILASVFEQEEEEMAAEPEPEVKIPEIIPETGRSPAEFDLPFPSETIPSLDTKYLSLLHDIMKSDEMSQEDFSDLARQHDVMPRAAFDDINTWADEELGDFLLEEIESRIVINYKK